MGEIGSEFWDVPTIKKSYSLWSDSTQWFLSGRSALQAIVKELETCHTVAMPSWCCDSMIKPFIDVGMDVHFYPIYWEGGLIREISLDCDVLFLMDYFGYTTDTSEFGDYNGVVIRDVTHSIFSTTYSDADYYFGSLRKWCGVWTGGYAWKQNGHMLQIEQSEDHGFVKLREQAMRQKAEYMDGLRSDKDYLKVFGDADESLESVGIAPASSRDMELATKLDIGFIRTQRRENAEVLRTAFSEQLVFPEMKSADIPLFVPVLVPEGKRDILRQYLIKNAIYCPIHWPVSKYHKLSEKEYLIYDNELSLVCDQRYTQEDMYRMVEVIKQFWKGV